jgi:putative effector of murein hydrolase
MMSSWALATALGLNDLLRLSLLPRSISTPFAMTISGEIGGAPDLTAVFGIVTGIVGALVGETMLARFPIARRWRAVLSSVLARTPLARRKRTRSVARKAQWPAW